MANTKLQSLIASRGAKQRVSQNIDFDLDEFLDGVGPTPSFSEKVGPTAECLTVDMIRALHINEIEGERRTVVEQHISVCQVCSGLVDSFREISPEKMPEGLFAKITNSMGAKRESKRWFRLKLPIGQHVAAWVAVPVLALMLLWIAYPARVYLKPFNGLPGGYGVNQQAKISIPSDPDEMQKVLDKLVADVNRGDAPPPKQVEWALRSVAAKSASAGEPEAKDWASYGTQLSAISAASYFEAYRKKEGVNVVPLKITNVADEKGIPTIVVANKKILEDEQTRKLLEKSLRQSRIPRLLVYQGDMPVYEITANNTKLVSTDNPPKEP